MKSFKFENPSGSYAMTVIIQPYRESLWCAAFGVDSLDGLFDMTSAGDAKPILDAAISRFTNDPESLRPLLSPADRVGMYGNLGILRDLRQKMVRLGGTISGAVDESPDPE